MTSPKYEYVKVRFLFCKQRRNFGDKNANLYDKKLV